MIPRHLSAGLHNRLGRLTRDLKNVDARHPQTVRAALRITDDLIDQLTGLRKWLADKLDDEMDNDEEINDGERS